MDPRYIVATPKYNPTRTWTAEGALGLGGPCFAIYPVESPGGYQLVGRSLPIFDLDARNAAFKDSPFLLRAGDRVTFERVEEERLEAMWEDVRADRYTYDIEDGSFDVGAYLEWLPEVKDEAAERRRRWAEASAATPIP
jgi:urea carboxylase